MMSYQYIESKVKELGEKIGAPHEYLVVHKVPQADGTPYVEIDDLYRYLFSERGEVFAENKTAELDELLFWIFERVTSKMARDFEMRNRQSGDSRRLRFQEQIRLMSALDEEWGRRVRQRIEGILVDSPYSDSLDATSIVDKIIAFFKGDK